MPDSPRYSRHIEQGRAIAYRPQPEILATYSTLCSDCLLDTLVKQAISAWICCGGLCMRRAKKSIKGELLTIFVPVLITLPPPTRTAPKWYFLLIAFFKAILRAKAKNLCSLPFMMISRCLSSILYIF